MRVTNQLITRNSTNRLQLSLQGIDRLREDISSGVRLRKMSDDPVAAGEVVRVGSSMRAIGQFRRNIDIGLLRTQSEEATLDQLSNSITRAVELGISQATSTASAQSRLVVKTEVDLLIKQAVGLGNSKVGDDYLFGGTRAGEAPFRMPPTAADGFSALTAGGNPVDPSGSIELEIGDGNFITPTHNGTDVFLTTDTLEALRALSTALGNNDVAAIGAATDRLNVANGKVQSLFGTVGARVNEMEAARTNLDAVELSLKAFRADLRDTEVDKAIAELIGKQTLYEAAMGATSRILNLSLANYL